MKAQYLLAALVVTGFAGCTATTEEPAEHTPSIPKRAIDMAKTADLEQNLSSIRQFIGMYRSDNEGRPPASIEDLKSTYKLSNEIFINPVDGKPLVYDPATGTIDVEGGGPMSKRSKASTLNNTDPGAIAAPALNPTAAPADGESQ